MLYAPGKEKEYNGVTRHDFLSSKVRVKLVYGKPYNAKIGTIQRRLAWPLRKDDTHKSRRPGTGIDTLASPVHSFTVRGAASISVLASLDSEHTQQPHLIISTTRHYHASTPPSIMPPASSPISSPTSSAVPALPVLSAETKATIKSTAPLLASHGPTITQAFYPLLFSRYPSVKQLFNKRNQAPEADGSPPRQPQALANAVWAYAANIDNLGALSAAISLIAHKHASLHVLPEHYPMVGECLLAAIEQVLGKEVATEGVLSAWGQAYGFLAAVFIQTEDGLRAKNARKRHGWVGWREMKVARKVKETVDVTSFYFTNLDETEPVCSFMPGQYISLKLTMPNGEVEERDYSLSEFSMSSVAAAGAALREGEKEAKGEAGIEEGNDMSPPYFRISIKRLPGGAVSTYMYDTVFFIHTARDKDHFPFAARLQTLVSSFPSRFISHVSFTQALTAAGWEEGGKEGGKDAGCMWGSGRLTAATLHEALGTTARPQDCTFYFCGPTEYMVGVRRLLAWLGVPAEEVQYECFGPAVTEIEAAGVVPSCY
ncbi:hypothetical protein VYU27_009705 [Nannochloropsis oceanica]